MLFDLKAYFISLYVVIITYIVYLFADIKRLTIIFKLSIILPIGEGKIILLTHF